MAILGELERAGLLHAHLPTVHSATLGDALNKWDIARTNDPLVRKFFMAAPGGVPTQTAFSQDRRWAPLDLDREAGVIRSAEHAFSQDGGLADRKSAVQGKSVSVSVDLGGPRLIKKKKPNSMQPRTT